MKKAQLTKLEESDGDGLSNQNFSTSEVLSLFKPENKKVFISSLFSIK